jgi:hypothetical protein
MIPAVRLEGADRLQSKLDKIQRGTGRAIANAQNTTVLEIQKKTIQRLGDKFTLRGKWFMPGQRFGFNVGFSKPTRLQASVGSRASWLEMQERGGRKQIAGKDLAIVDGANVRPSPSSRIPSRLKPRNLRRGFKLPLRQGGFGLFMRDKGGKPVLMYVIKPSAPIQPRLHFISEGMVIVRASYRANLEREYNKLVRQS